MPFLIVKFCETRTLLPIGAVDLGHVSYSREFDVAEFWSTRSIISVENWVDEPSPGPVHSSSIHPRFLVRTENRVVPFGCPKYKWLERRSLHVPKMGAHPAWDLSKFERVNRHKFGVFASAHHREIVGMEVHQAPLRYTPVPDWFSERFEVPYGFNSPSLESVFYRGAHLRNHPFSPIWKMIRAEHAANVAVELVYRPRGHHEQQPFGDGPCHQWHPRIYWVPSGVVRDILDVGIDQCVGFERQVANELRTILREIKLIDRANIWGYNRSLPVYSRRQTPRFASGDYVSFYPEDGETRLPDHLYLKEAFDAVGNPLGYASNGRSTRGELLTGSFRRDPDQFENWERV